MYARTARYSIDSDRLDEAAEAFREATRELARLEGFVEGYLFFDRDEGRAVTITLWSSLAACEQSSSRAASLRRRAVDATGGSVESVETYEVIEAFERD